MLIEAGASASQKMETSMNDFAGPASNGAFSFLGFTAVAAVTWFSASRPRFFIKTFVPREEYRHAVQAMLKDPNFRRSMRVMACLQFTLGILLAILMSIL
jgi:hypothetical protein